MKLTKVIFTLLTGLSLFALPSESQAASEGEFCGGIGAIQCDDPDTHCELDGNYPDAGGTCVPDYCGVWTGNTCPDGYTCDLFYPDYPDSNGVCIRDTSALAGWGELCGGFAGVQCEEGLECNYNLGSAGTCVPDICGVWTGTTCPDGFECELDDPNQPDSNGECVSLDPCANGGVCVIDGAGLGEFCGGIAGILCEDGLECELYGSYPDAGGECVLPAAGVGELCGGFAGTLCEDGLVCEYPAGSSAGTCYRPGSCEERCGNASVDESCYCDTQCAYFGDCCDDKAEYCG